MLKVYFVVSMLHTPDMKVVTIGPIDTLPTFQTYCEQRERREIVSQH
jgi:hypothetical protein